MERLLYINSSPRAGKSRTLQVAEAFIDTFKKKYPDCKIDQLDVFSEALPSLTIKMISGKYILLVGGELTEELKDVWNPIERHIKRFMSADAYLISVPMWNFGIPYALKNYIDIIIQPKYLFKYTENGIEGLIKGKKMVVITSRGGDYSAGSPFAKFDFQEPYLRAIFGLVGLVDMAFINAQPMDMDQVLAQKMLDEAKEKANQAAQKF